MPRTEVVYQAATDDKDQITYIATEDAKAAYQRRLEIVAKPPELKLEIRLWVDNVLKNHVIPIF